MDNNINSLADNEETFDRVATLEAKVDELSKGKPNSHDTVNGCLHRRLRIVCVDANV